MPFLLVSKVQAGFPSPADDYIESPLSLDDYLIDDPPATFFVKINGHSMLYAGIREGDIAVVNRAKKPKHHDMVVACIDNQFLLKQLIIEKQTLKLKSYHPDFPLVSLDENQGDMLWGVVVGLVRKL